MTIHHDLFGPASLAESESIAEGAVLLRRWALQPGAPLLHALGEVIRAAPLRHMVTARGFRMSVGMTNCGDLGWVSDRRGYRYSAIDPLSERPWPALPPVFRTLAGEAAAAAGFAHFRPDACLVNRYAPGSRLSPHQDKNERDLAQPIVSVSLGLPAVFLFGGLQRSDRALRVPLAHGDVVVWGGPARLRYHGVAPLQDGVHDSVGSYRINLTLRPDAASRRLNIGGRSNAAAHVLRGANTRTPQRSLTRLRSVPCPAAPSAHPPCIGTPAGMPAGSTAGR